MAYTTINDPTKHFNIVLHTGIGPKEQPVVGLGFQPDLLWQKVRSHTGTPVVYDSSRGNTKQIETDDARTESTQNTMVSSFDSDGFTMGTDTGGNEKEKTYVSWNWLANGGTRTTNTESGNNPAGGYQANTTAGFSIVDYTGTGAAGTMAHGLGAVPTCMIVKNRGESVDWGVYHQEMSSAGNDSYLELNTADAVATAGTMWNDTTPTSSVFTIGSNTKTNKDAITYIAYVFTPIQGYSKFGSYVGNGNANGTFVYTGFKPALVITKGGSDDWCMLDNKRNTFNSGSKRLFPNDSGAESTTANWMDFLSNGFKPRISDGKHNGDGTTYIYIAFAESPFVTSNGSPTNAR